MNRFHRNLLLFIFGAVTLGSASAASVTVPRMQLITDGTLKTVTVDGEEKQVFGMKTFGDISLKVEGGYKFGGELSLQMETTDLLNQDAEEELDALADDPIVGSFYEPLVEILKGSTSINSTGLKFQRAAVNIREIGGAPVDFTYFIGDDDKFTSGSNFVDVFGSIPFSSNLTGYTHNPDPTKPRFDGIYQVRGTGFNIKSTFGTTWNQTGFYVYQDGNLPLGSFSFDVRSMFNIPQFKADVFFGATIPAADMSTTGSAAAPNPYLLAEGEESAGYSGKGTAYPNLGFYRFGVLLYYNPGKIGEILLQAGVPRYDPVNDNFNINLFYFLFEPRITVDFFSFRTTFFYKPGYYDQKPTREVGLMDVNLDFFFGKPQDFPLSGGLETKFSFKTTDAASTFSFVTSPYLSIISPGVKWDLKTNLQFWPFDKATILQHIYLGITAEF